MPDMQKDLHPELEQSDKSEVSEMQDGLDAREATEEEVAAQVGRAPSESQFFGLERWAQICTAAHLRKLWSEIPMLTGEATGAPACGPYRSVEAGRDVRKESPRPDKPLEPVRSELPRSKEESREPSDEGQADRSNQGTGKAGDVDHEGSEGV